MAGVYRTRGYAIGLQPITVTIHKSRAISICFRTWRIHECTRADAHHNARDASPPLRPVPARPWATVRPSRVASGPSDALNGVDLAVARSHRNAEHNGRTRGAPPEAAPATESAVRVTRTPPNVPEAPRPAPSACASVRRPLLHARVARRPSRPTHDRPERRSATAL